MSNSSPQSNLILAQAKSDPGFKLPDTSGPDKDLSKELAAPASTGTASSPAPLLASNSLETPVNASDTASRDLAIGGGIFLVLLVVFFFARNAFVNHLVMRRVAPSSAGSAGWLLFLGLAFISGAAVLAMVNAAKFFSFMITGPLLVVGIGCLIGTALMGRR